MSRKNELARLAKILPTSEEVEAIIDSLREDSDIAAAVTGAAIAEARLEQLLKAKFRTKDSALMLAIFENRGPLSDFNSKILVAEASGVITRPMAAELQIIRAVRNAFAHAKRPLSFALPVVEDKVRKSAMLTPIDQLPPPHPTLSRGLPSTKGAYILLVRLLLIVFDRLEKSPAPAGQAIEEALAGDPEGGGHP